jgi:two-component system sensor histidine kinase GlrK
MAVYRPRSFLQLVLIGFSLVTLPLIVAIVNATISVGRLADQSRQAVHDAVQVTHSSRMLVEQLIAMERQARQYQVLGDEALLQAYTTAHEQFRTLTTRMASLPLDAFQQRQLRVLIGKEHEVFATLHTQPRDSIQSEKAAAEFVSLTELARSIQTQSNQLIDREIDVMQIAAGKAQRTLVWQILALIPGTLLFATIFVMLISRPIRQIDHAIRRLGEGDFASNIAIAGPRDLENLGSGLNWLRLRLLELEEAKRKFLGRVSHELKTPLTAIREGVELLAEEVVGTLNHQQHEIITILQQKSIHLQHLIENLLNFSMAQARSVSLVRKPVPLHHLLEDVAIDHKPVMIAKEVTLDLCSSEVLVWGDDAKLRAVIDNLMSNALKYSPDGGKIRITLQRHNGCAVLDVMDSGPGIALTERDRVFEAFYQGQQRQGRHIEGSGLGLSIAREYLMAHQGTIELIDDVSPGAHFRVTLPVQEL